MMVLLLASVWRVDAQTCSPKYFGPNAFQVPSILDGTRRGDMYFELGGDYIKGRAGIRDDVYDIHVKAVFPLFTDRVNLSLWWVPMEWYDMSPDVMAYRQIEDGIAGKGSVQGVLFLSTYNNRYFDVAADFGGYAGWRKDGDCPMTLRLRTDIGEETWPVRPFFEYQRGFIDWPFDQFRLGLNTSVHFHLPVQARKPDM